MEFILGLLFIAGLAYVIYRVISARNDSTVQVVENTRTTPTVPSASARQRRYGSSSFTRRGDQYYYDDGSLIEDFLLLAYITDTLMLEDGAHYEMSESDYVQVDDLGSMSPSDLTGPVQVEEPEIQAADMGRFEASTYEAPEETLRERFASEPTYSEPERSSYTPSDSGSSYDSGSSDSGGGSDD